MAAKEPNQPHLRCCDFCFSNKISILDFEFLKFNGVSFLNTQIYCNDCKSVFSNHIRYDVSTKYMKEVWIPKFQSHCVPAPDKLEVDTSKLRFIF